MGKSPSAEQTVDLDLQGIVSIRLINPSTQDVVAFNGFARTPQPAPASRADIIIRFQEMVTPAGLIYLGLNAAAFADTDFFVLNPKSGRVHARVPFATLGQQPCEIICQRGLGAVPFLTEFIYFTLLKKNLVALHASAFLYNDAGILVTGWAKGGKTESLLAFAEQGAHYVGDEWVVLSGDGSQMFGLPVPITIWEWQFKYVPRLLPRPGIKKRLLFRGIHLLEALHGAIGPRWQRSCYPLKLLDNGLPSLRRQLKIVESPRTIFADRLRAKAPLDKIFLTMSRRDPDIRIERCEPRAVAARMAHSNSYEQKEFFEYYRTFKFAFPDRQNEFLETAHERQSVLLHQALSDKEAYQVAHPYPVALDELFRQLRPFCEHVRRSP